MRKALLILAVLGLVAVALVLLGVGGQYFLTYIYNPFWDAWLLGPYPGVPYEAEMSGEPVSVLALDDVTLEVYEVEGETCPVLIVRSPDEEVLSQTLLVPEETNAEGNVRRAWLKDLQVHKREYFSKHKKGGKIVLISCEYEWGGREAGLLCLNEDGSFGEMWLSW